MVEFGLARYLTKNQKKLFFNLRKAKRKISVLDEGDMRPNQVKLIVKQLGVTAQDVIDMNRWLGGDASLNAPIREDGDTSEWQDTLVDESPSQEAVLVESDEFENRRKALASALSVLNNRERRSFEARRLAENPITLEELAEEFGVSRERVRQIDVSSFEKVQKAVKNRVAVMEAPTPLRHISFQFSPVVGEPSDGSVTMGTFYGNRTTRESRRSPVANRQRPVERALAR